MNKATIDGITLEYESSGAGDPIVCIHGALVADTFASLRSQPELADRYRLITYRRRGYAGSSRVDGPVSVEQQAADCRALLQHLRLGSAHVVGHSYGGCIALQLALTRPDLVRSLALLEPALAVGLSAASYRSALKQGVERFRAVGAAATVEGFMESRWPGYRTGLEEALPGALDQAIADAATTFEKEIPGLLGWSLDEATARRITQPVLVVLGAQSEELWPRFGETHRALLAWLPNAEEFILPRAHHFLQVENPRDMAKALGRFCGRQPS